MTVVADIGGFQVGSTRAGDVTQGKSSEWVAKTDILVAKVQTVSPKGGETNLHSHGGTDALWVVMEGEATFYGDGDRVVATLKPRDTLLVPRDVKYWFKSSSAENLVILRVAALAPGVAHERTNYTPPKDNHNR